MRRPSISIAASALVLTASACGSSASRPRSPRVPGDTTVSVVVAPVAHRAVEVAAPRMREPTAPALAFETVSDALERACPADPNADVTTLSMQTSEAAHTKCLEREADKAKTAFLASLPLDDARMERVADLDAALARLVDDVCWASEEVRWVDFEEGTRDDGTLRGFERLGCQARAQVERAYLFRAMAANAPAAFARHLDDAEPRGRREAFFLHALDAKAHALASKSSPAQLMPGERALDTEARHQYVARVSAIARAAPDVARRTCALFEGLVVESHGELACERKATSLYVSLGSFETNGEDVAP